MTLATGLIRVSAVLFAVIGLGYLVAPSGIANAWIWVVVTGIAWAVGWLITASVGVALAPGWPVYGASGAFVSQIVTAVALWRLVPSRDAIQSGA
jgi:hypothetical protein